MAEGKNRVMPGIYKPGFLLSLLIIIGSAGYASTLSVSDIDYVSNSSFYDDGHLQVEFLADGTGETISTRYLKRNKSDL